MPLDLTAIKGELADLADAELCADRRPNGVPPVAYGLLGWIEGACDWELNRRASHHYDLLPPDAAIDPSEDAVSIEATNALRVAFAAGDMAPAMLKFIDALAELLAGGEREH